MPNTPQDHWDYTLKEWSNEPFTKILEVLPEGISTIYDIGANVGGWTAIIHQKYPEASITSFEPVDRNYEALEANTPYAHCVNAGIYYGATSSKVLWRGENCGAFFVEQINAGEPRVDTGENMSLMTLELFSDIIPDLVKLDVEGAEENILEHSTILKQCPHIIVEWHPDSDPFEFFKRHLPQHEVKVNLSNKQFLLTL